jgi:hypothetical protein
MGTLESGVSIYLWGGQDTNALAIAEGEYRWRHISFIGCLDPHLLLKLNHLDPLLQSHAISQSLTRDYMGATLPRKNVCVKQEPKKVAEVRISPNLGQKRQFLFYSR